MSNETSSGNGIVDGYSIPLYGLDNGSFYYIHIPAILCIVASFSCALVEVVLLFRGRGYRTFFRSWSKRLRFMVYMAFWDGLFNLCHFADHFHIAVSREMVRPKELCQFYGFNLTVFVSTQFLMANNVAITAFLLIYCDKKLNLGRYDWKLLLWTVGIPFVMATTAGFAGWLGPNGTYCHFDAVKGRTPYLILTVLPVILVFLMNVVLYTLTWIHIYRQVAQVQKTLGGMTKNMAASHRSARAMSMIVVAFVVQWWAGALFGVWRLVDVNVPQVIVHCVTVFSNIGGVLNLGVYFLTAQKRRERTASSIRVSTISEMTRHKSSGTSSRSQSTDNSIEYDSADMAHRVQRNKY